MLPASLVARYENATPTPLLGSRSSGRGGPDLTFESRSLRQNAFRAPTPTAFTCPGFEAVLRRETAEQPAAPRGEGERAVLDLGNGIVVVELNT